jgi:hypothetical protein
MARRSPLAPNCLFQVNFFFLRRIPAGGLVSPVNEPEAVFSGHAEKIQVPI